MTSIDEQKMIKIMLLSKEKLQKVLKTVKTTVKYYRTERKI